MGLTPAFSLDNVFRRIDKFANERIRRSVLVLSYIGENFVNRARDHGNYRDHTGNLRSSIGWVIVNNGKIEKKKIVSPTKGGAKGKQTALELADKFSKEFNEGLILVVFAGMEYAAAVESRGYDVLTGSVPMAKDILRELKKDLE